MLAAFAVVAGSAGSGGIMASDVAAGDGAVAAIFSAGGWSAVFAAASGRGGGGKVLMGGDPPEVVALTATSPFADGAGAEAIAGSGGSADAFASGVVFGLSDATPGGKGNGAISGMESGGVCATAMLHKPHPKIATKLSCFSFNSTV